MPEDPWRRTIDCRDAGNRPRTVELTINEDDKLVLHAPPGEHGLLDLTAVGHLRKAAEEAEREIVERKLSRP